MSMAPSGRVYSLRHTAGMQNSSSPGSPGPLPRAAMLSLAELGAWLSARYGLADARLGIDHAKSKLLQHQNCPVYFLEKPGGWPRLAEDGHGIYPISTTVMVPLNTGLGGYRNVSVRDHRLLQTPEGAENFLAITKMAASDLFDWASSEEPGPAASAPIQENASWHRRLKELLKTFDAIEKPKHIHRWPVKGGGKTVKMELARQYDLCKEVGAEVTREIAEEELSMKWGGMETSLIRTYVVEGRKLNNEIEAQLHKVRTVRKASG